MKTFAILLTALLCLASLGRSQDGAKDPKAVKDPKDAKNPKGPKDAKDEKDPKDPKEDPKEAKEKPKSPYINRYGYEFNEKLYPQKSPKDTLESMIKVIIDGRIEYMLAHLADPEYVDAKVAAYMKGFDDVEQQQGKTIQSARLEGASLTELDEMLTQQLKLASGQGFIVDNIDPRSNVARAGLRNKDILVEVNKIKAMYRPAGVFLKALAGFLPDERVEVVVLRGGKIETIKGVPLADLNPQLRNLAFRRLALETTNLFLDDAARIRELRMFARNAEWKIDDDRAAGALKQLAPRQVFLRLRDGRWFLENRQTSNQPLPAEK